MRKNTISTERTFISQENFRNIKVICEFSEMIKETERLQSQSLQSQKAYSNKKKYIEYDSVLSLGKKRKMQFFCH